MTSPLDYAPIAAACFAVPEFLPQLRKLAVTGDAAGISWSWGVLTSVNNAAWLAYFTLSHYWTALIPSASATILATALAVMLTRRGQARPRPAIVIGAWAALLTGAFALAGRAGLGTLLTVAFILQVTPSIWTAYRTARPTGIAAGTWLLILGELTCWLAFGVHKSDPRLVFLGTGGITSCALILVRICQTSRKLEHITSPAGRADGGGRDQDNERGDPGGDQEGPVEAGRQRVPVGGRGAGAVGGHCPGHGAEHREADGSADLTAGVEQAGGYPGVVLGDPGQGDQRQRDEQQAESKPEDQARAEQPAGVAAVLGQPR
jgi:uncharacterized protein with PQ loop repeat